MRKQESYGLQFCFGFKNVDPDTSFKRRKLRDSCYTSEGGSPERNLIAAVLMLALEDIAGGVVQKKLGREQALEWIRTEGCEEYCEIMDLDYQTYLLKAYELNFIYECRLAA